MGVLVEVRDLTESRGASETIRRLADFDALTGLPGRALFGCHVEQALNDAGRAGGMVAVLMIGLDRFGRINDAFGPSSGDRVLEAVGRTLSAQLSPRRPLARFGGDEFLVLLPDLEGVMRSNPLRAPSSPRSRRRSIMRVTSCGWRAASA